MAERELMTPVQAENINVNAIQSFLQSPLGLRVKQASDVRREIPFSLSLPIKEVNPMFRGDEDEKVLVQGVIDCLIRDEDGYILIDYKTDGIANRFAGGFKEAENVLRNRYTVQISLYEKAIGRILKIPVKEAYLYFFDGGHTLKMK
jgi:ATP-dependent helicase/nuclease subunit A